MSWIKNLFAKKDSKAAKAASAAVADWGKDRYESLVIQRNTLVIILLLSIAVIGLSVFTIRYIRSNQSIEPFVIEIERKTGVPTVVEPLSIQAFSADEAIKRYFVMKYIRAREEYFKSTFDHNYYQVVRVLSSSDVYNRDYRPKFNPSNPESPYNIYGENFQRVVNLKSIIFPSTNTAQVRMNMEVNSSTSRSSGTKTMDKIVYMEFKFANIQMNDEERLINPLGFQVTLYRIDNERGD